MHVDINVVMLINVKTGNVKILVFIDSLSSLINRSQVCDRSENSHAPDPGHDISAGPGSQVVIGGDARMTTKCVLRIFLL